MDLRDIVAPRRCLACRTPGRELCTDCDRALQRLDGPCCARCGSPVLRPVACCLECDHRRLAFAAARAAVALEGPAPRLLHAWKDRGLRAVVDHACALVVSVVPQPTAGLIVPVPSLGRRAAWRGADGVADLARRLGAAWEIEVAVALQRCGAAPQRGLDRIERRRNAARSFRSTTPVGGTVVLVDDVYTTGATADQCARLLRRAGARRVEVVTFARAVRRT